MKRLCSFPLPGRSIVASALLVALVGCEAFDVADDSQWYAARVTSVLSPSELRDSANRHCIEGLTPEPAQIAVVTVRLHRALHSAAFAIPPSMVVRVQDDVSVNFRQCQLRSGHA